MLGRSMQSFKLIAFVLIEHFPGQLDPNTLMNCECIEDFFC